ncbi:MAG: amidase [Sneathiella sp.]
MTLSTKPIWQWSATETVAAIAHKKITVKHVISEHVDRMRAVNGRINAITIDRGDIAIIEAEKADELLASCGEIGPLFGLPITIKHNVDVEGFPNSNGVPALQTLIAAEDTPLVERFRNAGAIVIGLTNVPEFSLRAMTDNPIYGLTLNPWDEDVTCGGSSGGAGAALAAGVGSLAHGNDIGGSLRWPAYCNGVHTIRPTFGRVAAYNATASAERSLFSQLMSVQGPMARTVDDLKLGLEIMTGFDARDPWSVPAPLNGDGRSLPKRVAMIDLAKTTDLAPSVRASLEKTAEALRKSGYDVSCPPMPDISIPFQAWFDVMTTEIQTLQWDTMQTAGSDKILKVLNGYFSIGKLLDLKGYMTLAAERSAMIREWLLFLEEYPLILTPVSTIGSIPVDADLKGHDAVAHLANSLRFTTAINFLGLPAIVSPIDMENGRPVGVQLISTRYREDICLEAAKNVENQLGEFYDRFQFPQINNEH